MSEQGLVGHWKFNEKQELVASDSSRYKNHGTITLGAGKWQEKGLYFDGAATYVNVLNSSSLNFGMGNFTILLWLKTISITTSRILNKASTQRYQIEYRSNGTFRFNVSDGVNPIEIVGVKKINDNIWHQITMIKTTNRLDQYVDSIFDAYITGTINTLTNLGNLIIGANTITTGFFPGTIDEVRIYNRAKSANEILKDYNTSKHKYI